MGSMRPEFVRPLHWRPTLEIIGTAAAEVGKGLAKSTVDRFRRARTARAASAHRDRDATQGQRLVAHYERSGQLDALYLTETFTERRRLPLLFEHELLLPNRLGDRSRDPIDVTDPHLHRMPYDEALIKRRQKQGAKLWDGAVLYARDLETDDAGRTRILAGVCNYFAYVTLKEKLGRASTRLEDESGYVDTFSSFRNVLNSGEQPITLAATTACVFEGRDGREIAIQRRSEQVVSGAGSRGLVPMFGLESNVIDRTSSAYDVVTYNFLKEFAEEFFGAEEVIKASTGPHAHPDAVLDVDEARLARRELTKGRLQLRLLGMGLDVRDGGIILALLAHFTSPHSLDEIKRKCRASWESVSPDTGEKPIRFLPYDGEELMQVVDSGEMDATGLFVLDLTRRHFGSEAPAGGGRH